MIFTCVLVLTTLPLMNAKFLMAEDDPLGILQESGV